MLSPAQLEVRAGSARTRRGQPLPSPKQRYQAYLMQRIEDYKNSLARDQLLQLGNDAAVELQDTPGGQYILTEVVAADMVDRLIAKRLRLPTFRKWREKFARVREAQREPTHWGIERGGALATVLPRLEPDDHAVIVGAGAEAAAYLLAALDLRVTCLIGDDAACTRIENRMAAEALTGSFSAYVVALGSWFPDLELPVHLVVIDSATLAELTPSARLSLMARLQDVTAPEGVHALLPSVSAGDAVAESWLSLYPDWVRVPLRADAGRRTAKRAVPAGILLGRPAPRPASQASFA